MPTPTPVEEGRRQQGEEGAGLHRMEVEEGGALLEEEEEVEGGALAEEEVEEGDPAPGSPPSARASAGAGPAPTAGAPDNQTWTASTRCNSWPTCLALPSSHLLHQATCCFNGCANMCTGAGELVSTLKFSIILKEIIGKEHMGRITGLPRSAAGRGPAWRGREPGGRSTLSHPQLQPRRR